MRILIVEDSHCTRHVLKTLCEELGHEVTEATDGYDGVQRYEGHDCVLMDLHLPGRDGWDTAQMILERDPNAHIIACTSNFTAQHQAYCLKVGMLQFLPKPVDLQGLREVLEAAAKHRA